MLRRLLNKFRHPRAHIAPRAEIHATTLGEHTVIHPRAHLTDCHIGAHTYIARETHLNNVTIGRFTSIGPRTLAGTGEHPANLLTTSPEFYSTLRQTGHTYCPDSALQPFSLSAFSERAPIRIGNDVWVGAHVFIRDGITIHDGAIIAAGAIVTHDVPAYHIYGGIPARLIRPRFTPEIIAQLRALAWWNWPDARLRAAQPHLASTDPQALLAFANSLSHSPTPSGQSKKPDNQKSEIQPGAAAPNCKP